jgi:hypothetical protein
MFFDRRSGNDRRRKEAKSSGEPGWSWRRVVIFPNVIGSFWIVYVLINGPDTRVNETIAWGMVLNIITSVFFYTGFATAQDIVAIFATRTGLPYANPPVAIDGDPAPDPPNPDDYPPDRRQ